MARTLEEVIKNCIAIAEKNRHLANEFRLSEHKNISRVFQETAQHHEQLAEWLTELKQYRDKENEVYIVYSAELDVRNCILGVFSNMGAAQDFEDHCYSEDIGSILIREAIVSDKFIPEDK